MEISASACNVAEALRMHTGRQTCRHAGRRAGRTTVWLKDVGLKNPHGPSDKQGMGSLGDSPKAF